MRLSWKARRNAERVGHASRETSVEDLLRAARVLALRSRREADGLFVGGYASAFRGTGMEFEESRPYVPGDDVGKLDWNATARTGDPYVKRFREARDQALVLALDVSASMAFGTTGRTKAAAAAHAGALLAAAAGQVGDRVGLICFDESVREDIRPAKGRFHTARIIEAIVRGSNRAEGGTRFAPPVDALLRRARHRTSVVLLSDFRVPTPGGDRAAALARLCRRHEVVSLVLRDPAECALPRVGRVRVRDPERPGESLLLDSSSPTARARYARAWAIRSRALEQSLRSVGSDVLWLDAGRDPLRPLLQLFHERAARPRRVG